MDVDVDEDNRQFILCPGELPNGSRCNATIYLSRKVKDNPLACPECGQPLRIFEADGVTPLNQHMVLLDTPLAVIIADRFKQAYFPNVSIAQRWRAFEKGVSRPNPQGASGSSVISPQRVLHVAEECLAKFKADFGSACWAWIMARCANKIARESVNAPAPEPIRKHLVVE